MKTVKWVTLYTSNSQMLEIDSMKFDKNQQEHSRENGES